MDFRSGMVVPADPVGDWDWGAASFDESSCPPPGSGTPEVSIHLWLRDVRVAAHGFWQ